MKRVIMILVAMAAAAAFCGVAMADTSVWDGMEVSMKYTGQTSQTTVKYTVNVPSAQVGPVANVGTSAGLFNYTREKWFGTPTDYTTNSANFDNDWIYFPPTWTKAGPTKPWVSNPSKFTTFCIELDQVTNSANQIYNVKNVDDGVFGKTGSQIDIATWQADAIRELWAETVYRWNGSTAVAVGLTPAEVQGLQVGIWEIIYEYEQGPGATLNALFMGATIGNDVHPLASSEWPTSGTYKGQYDKGIKFVDNAAVQRANQLLVGVDGAFNIKNLSGSGTHLMGAASFDDVAFLSDTFQNQSMMMIGEAITIVPLPAAVWPGLAGLAAMLVAQRRRRRLSQN